MLKLLLSEYKVKILHRFAIKKKKLSGGSGVSRTYPVGLVKDLQIQNILSWKGLVRVIESNSCAPD